MSRLLLSIMICMLLAGCISNSTGLEERSVNYEKSFTFPGKDKYQLLGLSSKWLKENLGIVDFEEQEHDKDTGIITVQLSDRNIALEIIVHNEGATILCREARQPGAKVQPKEMQKLVADFERYINRFSSMGMWELPEGAEW